jgi:hypothetical protein
MNKLQNDDDDNDVDREERKLRALLGHETKDEYSMNTGLAHWGINEVSDLSESKKQITVEVKHTTRNGVGKVGRLSRKEK